VPYLSASEVVFHEEELYKVRGIMSSYGLDGLVKKHGAYAPCWTAQFAFYNQFITCCRTRQFH